MVVKSHFEDATQKLLARAAEIDRLTLDKFDAQYTLYDITYALRSLYKDSVFREKYVGHAVGDADVPWAKGFCALSTIATYELYGGAAVWTPSAIRMDAWKYGPVVFLRHNDTGIAFDTTGDQFAPLRVPYEVGSPINRKMSDMRTPNKEDFIAAVRAALYRE